MKITDLTPVKMAELRAAARQSDKKCKEVLLFLTELRIDADMEWDEESPTPHIYYSRLDSLACDCRNSLIAAAIMKSL